MKWGKMTIDIVQLSDKAFSLFEGTEKDRNDLLALHRGYLDANSKGLNVEALREVWSDNPDCVWFNSTGYNYHGIEEWACLWEFFGPRVDVTEPWRSMDVRLIGNNEYAVITCERTARGNWKSAEYEPHWTGDPWPSRSTEVFAKEDGEWICVHVHISTRETGLRPEEQDEKQ